MNQETKAKKKLKGPEGFDQYYLDLFQERWPSLRHRLEQEAPKFSMKNPFSEGGLKSSYDLDWASTCVADALDFKPGARLLDMCAAPGGKSLRVIFNAGGLGEFVLNDLSRDRVSRLKRVIREHVPESLQERIRITCRDASRWGQYEPESYDFVLLDAPCSGERHILADQKELKNWSQSRLRGLAQRQYALLCSAVQCLKPGGQMVYSTCALTPEENDHVVSRFLERKPGQVEVQMAEGSLGQATNWGWQILPDDEIPWGPMYFSVLRKIS